MKAKPSITRKQLDAMPKADLVTVVRDMEAYLLSMAKGNDEMSWRGSNEKQQLHFTRSYAFDEAALRLQNLVTMQETDDKH
jgi:hypothetical protein